MHCGMSCHRVVLNDIVIDLRYFDVYELRNKYTLSSLRISVSCDDMLFIVISKLIENELSYYMLLQDHRLYGLPSIPLDN